MTATYTRSNGDTEVIANMVHTHLVAALAKLQREEPDRETEIADMQSQVALNEARFADQRATLEAEGWRVEEGERFNGQPGFLVWKPGDGHVNDAKTEDAAWAKAWSIAHPNA